MDNKIKETRFGINGWQIRGATVYGWLKLLMDVSSQEFESELQRSEKRRLATLVVFRKAKRRLKMVWRDNTKKDRVIANQLRRIQTLTNDNQALQRKVEILDEIFSGPEGDLELDLLKMQGNASGESARPGIEKVRERLGLAV